MATRNFIFDETQADLNKFDKIIDEVEPGSMRLPVLIKNTSSRMQKWWLSMSIRCSTMR